MSKVFVETSAHLLQGIDEMVKEGYYSSRSEAVNEALSQLLKQYKISKLYAKDANQREQAIPKREQANPKREQANPKREQTSQPKT